MNRREYLQRLILGLEMQIPEFRSRLQYYEEGEVEYKYAIKFVAAMEENLKKAKTELESLGE